MTFEKGNKFGKGRPLGSKNILPLIREKVLQLLDKRLTKGLDATDEALLRFAQSVMPKETRLSIKPDIEFISSVPRPQGIEHKVEQAQPQPEQEVKENKDIGDKKNLAEMGPDIGGSPDAGTSSNFSSPLSNKPQPLDMEGVREGDYYLNKDGRKVYKVVDEFNESEQASSEGAEKALDKDIEDVYPS